MSVAAKQAKQVVIDEIRERIENAGSVVVVDYLGLSVAEADELRSKLREEGVEYTVYKNTLIRRAIDDTAFAGLAEGDALKGSTALAFSHEDVTAGARVLSKAIKDYKKMAFKGGIVEGQVYGKDQIEEFANIPSRETLIARFMGSIQSPMTKLALTLKAIAEQGGAPEAPAKEAEAEAPAEEAAPAEAAVAEEAEAAAEAEASAETAPAEAAETEASAEAEAPAKAEAPADAEATEEA